MNQTFEPVTCEEEIFNNSIKNISQAFDNLKRCRRQRDRLESELKDAIQKIESLNEEIQCLRRKQPEPVRIRRVEGIKAAGDSVAYVLAFESISQGPDGAFIRVFLP